MNGKLYIVATPIGNLDDMTPRAVEILKNADIIAAEDTENSMKLLTKFDIRTKLVSNHKFNEINSADYFIRELLNGRNIAVISDAGTPCISDPGGVIVKKAAENNIEIIAVPGACAAAAAISVSGFVLKSFVFEGFFPREKSDMKKIILKLKNNPGVYVFYESPKRIIKTFEILSENLPGCNICLCNDLTKKFERIYRGSPGEVLEELRGNISVQKGEYTVIVSVDGSESERQGSDDFLSCISPEAVIADVMTKQKYTLKDAIRYISDSEEYDFTKNQVYAASLNLKKMFGNINN
ncbi:MAG: 16S rRNA (cytidine(1402)-2'-O)-methyltransferase [Oscillospiraceae bacterium]|nr:16S rRNA (cytidine(1402)-2'-O)-methyltransferase [Oscillospiraceae bacterium]